MGEIKYFLPEVFMNRSRCSWMFSGLLTAFLLTFSAQAQNVTFQDLSDEDFKKVVKDLSANFLHTSVSGASPLGDIFGFEIGLIGGMTNTKELNRFAKEVDPSAKANQIPHAELLGVLTVPLAITLEVGVIPKIGGDDFKFSSYSLAAKWSPSELFFDWPVAVAAKLHATKVSAEFKDNPNNVATTFAYQNTLTGATLLVSKNFALFEPYVGAGYVQSSGEMDVTGSTTVFTGSRMSASAKPTSAMYMLGTEVKLLVLKLGVEYTSVFDTSRFTGKLSFYF